MELFEFHGYQTGTQHSNSALVCERTAVQRHDSCSHSIVAWRQRLKPTGNQMFAGLAYFGKRIVGNRKLEELSYVAVLARGHTVLLLKLLAAERLEIKNLIDIHFCAVGTGLQEFQNSGHLFPPLHHSLPFHALSASCWLSRLGPVAPNFGQMPGKH